MFRPPRERIDQAGSPTLYTPAKVNSIRAKCFVVLLTLSVIGFGPLSLTALIGLYVVWRRPEWFEQVVRGVYRNRQIVSVNDRSAEKQVPAVAKSAIGTRIRCALALTTLLVLDIAPFPVVGAIGMYIIIRRPHWFLELVSRIYGHGAG